MTIKLHSWHEKLELENMKSGNGHMIFSVQLLTRIKVKVVLLVLKTNVFPQATRPREICRVSVQQTSSCPCRDLVFNCFVIPWSLRTYLMIRSTNRNKSMPCQCRKKTRRRRLLTGTISCMNTWNLVLKDDA